MNVLWVDAVSSSIRLNRVFMRYVTQSKSDSIPAPSTYPATSTASDLNRSSVGTLMYSQRDSLVDSLHFLSRSLMRMRIQHAVMGPSAIALKDCDLHPSGERAQEIELIMSAENYAKFRSTWVNQRLAAVDSDDRQFWDNRTGYVLRIYITGDWLKTGKRALRVPDSTQLPKSEDGIAYWIPDAQDIRRNPSEERRREKVAPYCTIAA
jgi:hypothetical protein